MRRREFLKHSVIICCTGSQVIANIEEEKKESFYLPPENAFIQYKGVWFIAMGRTIKWCPLEYEGYCDGKKVKVDEGFLPNKEWDSCILPGPTDQFHFWLEQNGHLFWVGKCRRWMILYADGLLSFQLSTHKQSQDDRKTPSG